MDSCRSKLIVSEEELMEVMHEFGYELPPKEVSSFRDDFEKYLTEEDDAQVDKEDANRRLFPSVHFPEYPRSSSSFINNVRSADRKDPFSPEVLQSPSYSFHSRRTSSSDNGLLYDSGAVCDLIYDGWAFCEDIKKENAYLAELLDRMETLMKNDDISIPFHNVASGPPRMFLREHSEEGVSEGALKSNDRNGTERLAASQPKSDWTAAIRPVLCPTAGGLPFRHDPVKMFELYRKEWSNNPAPGEDRRLSLRWKVREFLSKRDLPTVTYADLQKPREKNFEWSPKQYL